MFHWCVWIQRYWPDLLSLLKLNVSSHLSPPHPVSTVQLSKGPTVFGAWHSERIFPGLIAAVCGEDYKPLYSSAPPAMGLTFVCRHLCPRSVYLTPLLWVRPASVEGTAEGLAGEVMFVRPCCSCASFSSHISHPFGRKAKYSLACFAAFLTV